MGLEKPSGSGSTRRLAKAARLAAASRIAILAVGELLPNRLKGRLAHRFVSESAHSRQHPQMSQIMCWAARACPAEGAWVASDRARDLSSADLRERLELCADRRSPPFAPANEGPGSVELT